MSSSTPCRPGVISRLKNSAAFVVLALVALMAQTGHGQAPPAGPLKFFKNYFITGDYAVAGVGLDKTGSGGLVTGTVQVQGVPAGAEALAAFLYWQVISPGDSETGSLTATFNGRLLSTPEDLSPGEPIPAGPLSVVGDPFGTVSCPLTGGGSGNRVYAYRADVLRFLDVDDDGLQKITVPYQVALPDGGNSFQMPRALGASLVVIYRDPSPTAALNGIVLYDGNYTKQSSQTMTQTIAGFYDPAAVSGKITHITGSAQSNLNERLTVPGGFLDNGFRSAQGAAWDNLTVATASPGASSFVTSVAPRGLLSDCLTWGAIVYRTQVNDTDQDGLLNSWESSTSTILDPNGEPLPNLAAMGANPGQKDLFLEIASMKTTEPLHYGAPSPTNPAKAVHDHLPTYEALKKAGKAFWDQGIVLHVDVGNQYQGLPFDADNPVHIIPTAHARGGESMNEKITTTADATETGPPCVRAADDSGWVCQFSEYPGTVGWKIGYQFIRDMPLFANPAVNANDPTEAECEAAEEDGVGATRCDRVFDRNRKDIFHFVLFAHAIGIPKAPCLDALGFPDFACMGDAPGVPDPNFHVPVTNTGVGDLIGGDGMVTLGGFNSAAGLPVGTDYMQAATLAHELGHSLGLLHGAFSQTSGLVVPEPGCKPNYLSVMNYLFQLRGLLDDSGTPHVGFSGQTLAPPVDENAPGGIGFDPSTFPSTAPPFRTGWFAPKANVVQRDLDRGIVRAVTASSKHCDGSPLSGPEQDDLNREDGLGGMVRVDSDTIAATALLLDWDYAAGGQGSQDLNFDGQLNHAGGPLRGFNDWQNIRLNQVASRRNVGAWYWVRTVDNPSFYYAFMGPLSNGVTAGDLGKGGLGKGGLGKGGLGKGGLGKGGLGIGDLNLGDLGAPTGLGKGGLGKGGLGKGGLGKGGLGLPGNLGKGGLGKGGLGKGGLGEGQEMDKAIAVDGGGYGGGPTELKAFVRGTDGVGPTNSSVPFPGVWKPENTDCATLGRDLCHRVRVDWKVATAGKADFPYQVIREVQGGGTPQEVTTPYTGPVEGPFLLYDGAEFPNGRSVTYDVTASFVVEGKTITGTSRATITAVNDAPQAVDDNAYSVLEDGVLTVSLPADGVLFNDTDDDSPATSLRAAVEDAPDHGVLVLNDDGSFSYEPNDNFNGEDTFTYSAYNTCAFAAQCSSKSAPATVRITIQPVNDAPAGTGNTVTTLEDTAFSFLPAHFGFTDPLDDNMPFANGFLRVKVTAATKGLLKLNGGAIPADGFIALADLTAGNLKFFPAANENGLGYASFTFQVQDDGGTANGGKDLDLSENTMTINVTPVNDAPVGTNATVTTLEDTDYALKVVDFGLTNPIDKDWQAANGFNRVQIATLPIKGVLKLNGGALPADGFIALADVSAGNLKFSPAANGNGSAYTTFTFLVEDDGGTANAGVNLDPSPNTITINVTPVNDAPAGTDKTVTTIKNDSHSIRPADFGFTDPNDTPANAFLKVKIVTVPAASVGTLKLNGVTVVAGAVIPWSSLDNCKLWFVPKSGATGTTSFTFQVQDNGGTANSGVDLDPSANTLTLKVVTGSHNHWWHHDHNHW